MKLASMPITSPASAAGVRQLLRPILSIQSTARICVSTGRDLGVVVMVYYVGTLILTKLPCDYSTRIVARFEEVPAGRSSVMSAGPILLEQKQTCTT
eukprot:IDg23539t1